MPRRRPRTVYIERETGSSFLWFLIGGALGAGLALWFAPQSGDRTRQVVGRKLGKLRDAAEEAFDDLREAIKSPPEAVAAPVEETIVEEHEEESASASNTAARPKRGTGSARQELEQRLAEARARRRRVMADEDEEPVA